MTHWQVVGASVRGTSHERTNTRCQDAWSAWSAATGCILVVADGAGSAPLSDKGAKLATHWACQDLADALRKNNTTDWAATLRRAFRVAHWRVERQAVLLGVPVNALACTLTSVVCTDSLVAVAQIGDGLVVAQWADDPAALQRLSTPQRGEYANETLFLSHLKTEDSLEQLVGICIVERAARGVAAMTDGLLRLAVHVQDDYRPHSPFFLPFFQLAAQPALDVAQANAQIADFLASPRVCERTDDDKTIVIAYRVES